MSDNIDLIAGQMGVSRRTAREILKGITTGCSGCGASFKAIEIKGGLCPKCGKDIGKAARDLLYGDPRIKLDTDQEM